MSPKLEMLLLAVHLALQAVTVAPRWAKCSAVNLQPTLRVCIGARGNQTTGSAGKECESANLC